MRAAYFKLHFVLSSCTGSFLPPTPSNVCVWVWLMSWRWSEPTPGCSTARSCFHLSFSIALKCLSMPFVSGGCNWGWWHISWFNVHLILWKSLFELRCCVNQACKATGLVPDWKTQHSIAHCGHGDPLSMALKKRNKEKHPPTPLELKQCSSNSTHIGLLHWDGSNQSPFGTLGKELSWMKSLSRVPLEVTNLQRALGTKRHVGFVELTISCGLTWVDWSISLEHCG